jgi:NADPH:quinone reductase-like Zn-dependent oxidoreductase
MLFEYANLSAGQLCLVHGAAGYVGAYAVQLAHQSGVRVVATASANDADYLRELGANQVIDYRTARFDDMVKDVDAVIDLVGGETADRSYGVLKAGGVMVSAVVFEPSQQKARQYGVRAVFMLVDVTNERLAMITNLLESGTLKTSVGPAARSGTDGTPDARWRPPRTRQDRLESRGLNGLARRAQLVARS